MTKYLGVRDLHARPTNAALTLQKWAELKHVKSDDYDQTMVSFDDNLNELEIRHIPPSFFNHVYSYSNHNYQSFFRSGLFDATIDQP